jgi:hypothetical protein
MRSPCAVKGNATQRSAALVYRREDSGRILAGGLQQVGGRVQVHLAHLDTAYGVSRNAVPEPSALRERAASCRERG